MYTLISFADATNLSQLASVDFRAVHSLHLGLHFACASESIPPSYVLSSCSSKTVASAFVERGRFKATLLKSYPIKRLVGCMARGLGLL